MCAAMIGGMTRLRKDYERLASERGLKLKWFEGSERDICDKIGCPCAIIVCTHKVSHTAKRQAEKTARSRNIPCILMHACGTAALKDCLNRLQS